MFDLIDVIALAVAAVLYTVLAVLGAPFLLAALAANHRERGPVIALPAGRPPAHRSRAV